MRREPSMASFAGRLIETTFGVQTRYDDIDLGLTDTFQRSFLSNVRSDKVEEASVGVYAQNTVHWTDWLRTTLGWRGDYYRRQCQFALRCQQFRQGQCRRSAARNSRWCSVRSTRPNFSSEPASACTATTRAAPPSPKSRRPIRPTEACAGARRSWCGPRAPRSASAPRSFRDSILGQPVRPRSGLRDRVQRRCRRHLGEPAEPALRRRVDQQLSARSPG